MSDHTPSPYLMDRKSPFYSSDFPFRIDCRECTPEEFGTFDRSAASQRRLHWHDFFEIEYILNGRCLHVFDNTQTELTRGCAYIITPISFHNLFCIDGPFTIYHIAFDSSAISEEIMSMVTATHHITTAAFTPQECRYLEAHMKFLETEFRRHTPFTKHILRNGVEQILLLVLRRAAATSHVPEINRKVDVKSPVIQQAVSYLNLHFRNPVQLNEVAQIFHMSPNYFGGLFTRHMQVSFNAYLNNLRLEYAHMLLGTTTLTVSQICFESGFKTLSYFIDSYKKRYGETPSQTREQRKHPGGPDARTD